MDAAPVFHIGLATGAGGMYVAAEPLGDSDAVVHIYALPGRRIAVSPECANRLLEMNASYRFGALGVDDDGDIVYDQSFPSDGLTQASLARVIQMMASSADEIANELRMRFG